MFFNSKVTGKKNNICRMWPFQARFSRKLLLQNLLKVCKAEGGVNEEVMLEYFLDWIR